MILIIILLVKKVGKTEVAAAWFLYNSLWFSLSPPSSSPVLNTTLYITEAIEGQIRTSYYVVALHPLLRRESPLLLFRSIL